MRYEIDSSCSVHYFILNINDYYNVSETIEIRGWEIKDYDSSIGECEKRPGMKYLNNDQYQLMIG